MNTTFRNAGIAVALAVLGLILVSSYVSSQKSQLRKGQHYVTVVTAKKTIPAGTRASQLTADDYVQTTQVLRSDAIPGALSSLKHVGHMSVNTDVYAGSQLSAQVFATSKNLEYAQQIDGTERIISLTMLPFASVGGDVEPGDHVDIYGVSSDGHAVQMALGVEVLQTPGDTNLADAKPFKATDDARLYQLEVSDKVGAKLISWMAAANANSGGSSDPSHDFYFLLRPANGAQDTALAAPAKKPARTKHH